MRPSELIGYANKLEKQFTSSYSYESSFNFFTAGAKWMHSYQQILIGEESELPAHNYEWMGYVKYGLCLLLSAIAVFPLISITIWLVLLFIPLFYLFEIHLLFLFPTAISSPTPIIKRTIQATYDLGLFSSFRYTIYFAAYMLLGLLDLKKPFKRWKVGVLAVLILHHIYIKKQALPIF